MKSTRFCLACGNAFAPLLHARPQRYCSSKACQRARRRDWQRNRLRIDSDYRDSQARAQAKWRADHPHYWRKYRAAHPAYRERKPEYAAVAQRARGVRPIAKMDVIRRASPLSSGSTSFLARTMPPLQKWTCGPSISPCCLRQQRRRLDCKEMTCHALVSGLLPLPCHRSLSNATF